MDFQSEIAALVEFDSHAENALGNHFFRMRAPVQALADQIVLDKRDYYIVDEFLVCEKSYPAMRGSSPAFPPEFHYITYMGTSSMNVEPIFRDSFVSDKERYESVYRLHRLIRLLDGNWLERLYARDPRE